MVINLYLVCNFIRTYSGVCISYVFRFQANSGSYPLLGCNDWVDLDTWSSQVCVVFYLKVICVMCWVGFSLGFLLCPSCLNFDSLLQAFHVQIIDCASRYCLY